MLPTGFRKQPANVVFDERAALTRAVTLSAREARRL
jgi:hypothetical protein